MAFHNERSTRSLYTVDYPVVGRRHAISLEGQSVVWKKSGCAFLNQGNPLSLKWTETPRVAFPKVGYVTGQFLEKKPCVLLDR